MTLGKPLVVRDNMPARPNRDEYFSAMAQLTANRTTCHRRAVGCVIVNWQGHVLSTGYNGVARGTPHCRGGDKCAGADLPSGTGLDLCKAIHAEQNALLQCPDVEQIFAVYVTASPCLTCVKLLLNTSCTRIVFSEQYPHDEAKALWEGANREWVHFKPLE